MPIVIIMEGHLSLLTWNIYGLERGYLRERTEYICKYITEQAPSIVFLQEVIHSTWSTITTRLGGAYNCFCGTPRARYFPAVLVKKDEAIQCGKESVIDFPTSGQGRYLIQVLVKYKGKEITFLSSHIESLDEKRNVEERAKQLKTAFDKMDKINKSGGIAVFGGDTNTFDREIEAIGLPPLVQDIWVLLGSDKKKCKTWNTSFLVQRFDRVFFGPTSGTTHPVTFDLVGREKLPDPSCYPSDHLGIWINFEVG